MCTRSPFTTSGQLGNRLCIFLLREGLLGPDFRKDVNIGFWWTETKHGGFLLLPWLPRLLPASSSSSWPEECVFLRSFSCRQAEASAWNQEEASNGLTLRIGKGKSLWHPQRHCSRALDNPTLLLPREKHSASRLFRMEAGVGRKEKL